MPSAMSLRTPWMGNTWRSISTCPKYIEKDPLIRREPWYQQYRRAFRPKLVVVVQRGPGSYAIIFPRRR